MQALNAMFKIMLYFLLVQNLTKNTTISLHYVRHDTFSLTPHNHHVTLWAAPQAGDKVS